MAGVLATLKRFYTEDGAAIKHICWLVLSFIGAMISMPGTNGTTPDLDTMYSTNFISMIFGLILTIYSLGYNSIIMHNRFEEEGKNAWLCTVPEVVSAYDEDPACGFNFTLNGYQNLFYLHKDSTI